MSGAQHIIPDANLALHFKRLDQIDWRSITGAKTCVVHIPPVFLRELEEQKVHNDKKRLRDRAAATIRWLSGLADGVDPIILRDGVELRFVDHEPIVDFAANRLNERVLDDVLLASGLDLAAELDQSVIVASDDTGLKMKIRSRDGLSHLAVGEEYRLPIELDRLEKELREKGAELDRLKSRLPKLSVRFADGAEFHRVILRPRSAPIATMDEVKAKFPKLPTAQQPEVGERRDLKSIINYSSNHRYNERLDAYFEAYRKYLIEWSIYENFWQASFQVGFEIENGGRAPANSVEVIFEFPPTIKLTRGRELPKPPQAPEPPQVGLTILSNPGSGLLPSFDTHLANFEIDTDGTASIKNNRTTLQYSLKKLKHGFAHSLEKVYVSFVGDTSTSFSVSYFIHCDDADPEEGTLNFVVE